MRSIPFISSPASDAHATNEAPTPHHSSPFIDTSECVLGDPV